MVVDSHSFLKALNMKRAPPTVTSNEMEEHTMRARKKLLETMTQMNTELTKLQDKVSFTQKKMNEATRATETVEEELSRVEKEKERIKRALYRSVQEASELEAELVEDEQRVRHIRHRITTVGIERERLSKELTTDALLLAEEKMVVMQKRRDKLAEMERTLAREIAELTDSVERGTRIKERRMKQLKTIIGG